MCYSLRRRVGLVTREESDMDRHIKTINEMVLETLVKEPVSKKDLMERFPDFAYALDAILEIEKNAGRIEISDQNGEEYCTITKKGMELLTYRFNTKFLRLNV